MRLRFVDQRVRLLVAERDAAGIGGNRLRAAAEQPVERQADGLAADVPQRHVDAAHREAGAGAHAVARELARVDAVPHADDVVGVHAEDELREGSY